MITAEEAIEYLKQGYLRQLEFAAEMYEAEMRLGETIDNAYRGFAAEVGRPPLTDKEKKGAFLDYVLRRNDEEDDIG